jgi:hypothetical protein
MLSIAAIRPGYNVATEASGTAWPAVTSGATVAESGSDGEVGIDVSRTVRTGKGPLPLLAQKLALEKLSSTSNAPEGIACNDE